jgi:predicted deacylase
MYTHDRLWPKLSDLAAFVGSHCHLLASESGGSPFDEVSSCLWAKLSDRFSGFPIPMACESATIELRGELSVSDEYALQDAKAIYRFLQHRGYITQAATATATTSEVPALKRDASPLTGVDMVEAPVAGVVVWRVKPGDMVKTGTLLGEIGKMVFLLYRLDFGV